DVAVARTFVQVRLRKPARLDERARRERVIRERALGEDPRLFGAGVGTHQTTSAIEQLSPEPMPSSATRLPFFSRPISLSLDSTIGTDAGPMLPCSLKMVSTLAGSM